MRARPSGLHARDIQLFRTGLAAIASAAGVCALVWATLAVGWFGLVLAASFCIVLALISERANWMIYLALVTVTGVLIPVGPALAKPELVAPLFLIIAVVGRREAGEKRVKRLAVPVLFACSYLGVLFFSSVVLAPVPFASLWILLQIFSAVSSLLVIVYFRLWSPLIIRTGTLVIGSIAGIGVVGYVLASLGLSPQDLSGWGPTCA